MRDVKSFSIYKKRDKDNFKTFDLTRHLMKMDKTEAILKAVEEFIHNHPLDKINPLDNYLDGVPKVNTPMFSMYTDIKEIKKICNKTSNDQLIQMKSMIKKIINTIDLELESRIDR